MRRRSGVVFHCFSPPVMVATFLIEIGLAAYVVWRYHMTNYTRLIVALLVGLGVFQFAEYFVCTGFGMHGETWSRLGFVSISTLPPLGLHLMHVLAGKRAGKLVWTAYATLAAFSAFFLLYTHAFQGYQCTGNYVIFQIGAPVTLLYSLYYYGWILTSLVLGGHWLRSYARHHGGKAALKQVQTIRALIAGYLAFLLPVAIVNTINPQTIDGIPSIMCGFAVLLALVLGFYILPRVGEKRRK
jgi:hypothetical protein